MIQTGTKVLAIAAILVFAFSLGLGQYAWAQGNNPPGGGNNPPGGGDNPSFEFTVPNPLGCTGTADGPPILCLWSRIYAFIWQLAFPVATIMILVGAWQILTAAGDPKKFETGRKTILYTVIGLAIVLVAGSLPLLIQDILTNGNP